MAKSKAPTVTTEEIAALARVMARGFPAGMSDADLLFLAEQQDFSQRQQGQRRLFLVALAHEYGRCEFASVRQSVADGQVLR